MNKDLASLRAAIGTITSLIAGQGLRVTQVGVSAYVEVDPATGKPVRVNIPHLGDNASEALIMSIQGFIDHEVGHVLDTDWVWQSEVVATDKKIGANGLFHNLWNIVEDTYIERAMARRFPGTALNLDRLHKFFIAEITLPAVKDALKAKDRQKLVGYLLVPMARAWAGQAVFAEFMKAYWPLVADEVAKIGALAEQFPLLASTEDCFRLTEDLWLALNKPLEDEKDEGSGGKEAGEAGKPEKGAGGKGKGKGKPAPKAEKPEADEDGAGEGSDEKDERKGAGGEAGEDEDDAGAGAKEAVTSGASPGEDSGEDEGDGVDEEVVAVSGSGGGYGKLDELKGRKLAVEIIPGSFEDAIAEKIGATALTFARASDYRLFSKDWDIIRRYEVSAHYQDAFLTTLEDQTRQMVSVMQKEIERMMAARSLTIRQGGYRSGRVRGGALHRLITNDDRVFERKLDNRSKEVAVSLLVDCSGSMSGPKIKTAMAAAFALSQTLERVGIKHEVLGFTTIYWGNPVPMDKVAEDEKKIGRAFSRVEPIWIPIFKEVGERLTPQVKKRFADAPTGMRLAENIDGESVEYAATRLAARKEPRKVLIVLSDGQPACQGSMAELRAHLRKVVKDCTRSGIECIGIGIQSDAVRDYYPKHMVIHRVEDLPSVVMGQLKGLLTA